jgi:soluble lytic murein transglycosylase
MLSKLCVCSILAFMATMSSAQTNNETNTTENLSIMATILKPGNVVTAKDLTKSYSKERIEFKRAKTYLAKGERLKYAKIKSTLTDYPLLSYLEYADIAAHLRHTKASQVDAFLKANSDTSLAKRLRYIWLENLRKRDKWKQFITYYSVQNTTTKQQCFYQYARYRNGDKKQSLQAALALWKVGKSQPKDCDKIFSILIKQKLITEDIAWQRFTSAVINHENMLAVYLQRFFTSTSYKNRAKLYFDTHRNPALISNQNNYTENTASNRALIYHSIAHLAKKSSIDATNLWLDYSVKFDFNDTEQAYVTKQLLRNLYKNMHDGIADDLLRSSINPSTINLVESRIRKALEKLDWSSVHYWIKKLPTEKQESDRWKYWSARAEEKLSPEDTLSSDKKFQQLAQERSYFGYLSADKTSQKYLLKDKPVLINSEIWKSVTNNNHLIRSRELFLLGELTNARREWRYLAKTADTETMIAAAKLASSWGWHSQAAYGIVITKQWDDLALRFPSNYIDFYKESAKKYKLPLELMLALSRQESSFATDALSPSGAKGLMQLMPKTAEYIARKSNISYRYERELFQAEKNIQLGTSYYRYLMNDFDDNRILSTSSYNAGPNRTRQWLKKSLGVLPPDVWTEVIPFNETRRYVQNVLYFSVVYGLREGMAVKLLTEKEQNTLL